mmetsp:Transcript_3779/g.6983  ORF Transcript_3779/g.6983 Transcript_3779/m.6983 type:complete len:93 (+) Transcript_3779:270-548(+)
MGCKYSFSCIIIIIIIISTFHQSIHKFCPPGAKSSATIIELGKFCLLRILPIMGFSSGYFDTDPSLLSPSIVHAVYAASHGQSDSARCILWA